MARYGWNYGNRNQGGWGRGYDRGLRGSYGGGSFGDRYGGYRGGWSGYYGGGGGDLGYRTNRGYGDYDRDLSNQLREGWNDLKRGIRRTFSGGYDRGSYRGRYYTPRYDRGWW